MRSRSIWSPTLGIVGMVAWMLFILGCLQWSSWSPDSSKVLFTFSYPSGRHIGIALYDRTKRIVSPILIQDIQHSDIVYAQAQWAAGGSQIITAVVDNDDLNFLVSSLRPDIPIRQIHAGKVDTDSPSFSGPFPQLRGSLYFNNGHEMFRVDVASGTVQRKDMQPAPYSAVFTLNDQLYYSRELEKETSSDRSSIEFGTVDLTDLTPHRLYEFRFQDLEPELHLVAPHPDGQRFAMVAAGKEQDSILLFGQQGFEQVVNARGLPDHFRFGMLQWSKDGSVIYAAILTPMIEPSILQYSVAEISLREEPTRITPVCQLRQKGYSDIQPLLDISLSPDGNTIATTPALFETGTINEEDRVLFLIDMQATPRRVTRIPVPVLETPQVIAITEE